MKRSHLKINGESGAVLLMIAVAVGIVTIISFSVLTTMNTAYSRRYSEVKEAYKMITVMESASKVVKNAWDQAAATTTSVTPSVIAAAVAFPSPSTSCKAACISAYGSSPQICLDNTESPGAPYCFYSGATQFTSASLDMEMKYQNKDFPDSFEHRLLRPVIALMIKLNRKRDFPTNNSLLFPSTAFATTARSDVVGGAPPNCAVGSTNPACMKCGAGTGGACATIYSCPKIFPQCATYTGGVTGALFAQNFFLTPPSPTLTTYPTPRPSPTPMPPPPSSTPLPACVPNCAGGPRSNDGCGALCPGSYTCTPNCTGRSGFDNTCGGMCP